MNNNEPKNLEAEMAVLGCGFLSLKSLDKICDDLKQDMFYDKKNGIIFQAMYDIHKRNEVIDATVMYLQNTNRTYVRNPHYFIFKGSGYAMTSDLYAWVETLRQERKELENRSNSIQLQ